MSLLRSTYQCCVTVIIFDIDIRFCCDQKLHYSFVSLLRSNRQCCVTITIFSVEIGTSLNQLLYYSFVSTIGSNRQCRLTKHIVSSSLDRCPCFDQLTHNRPMRISNRIHYCCSTIFTLYIELCP